MKLPEKIDKETKGGLFAWILESDNHASRSETNSAMIRELVKKYNDIIDYIKNYPI